MPNKKTKSGHNKKKQHTTVIRRAGERAGSKNGFNRTASFKTTSTYAGILNIPTTTTNFRIDILPALSVFPIAETAKRFMSYRATLV